jgi:hypothetical protein
MIFPLYEIINDKITSLKGEVSSLYKILHEDLSQKSDDDLLRFYEKFHQEVKAFKNECFYKIYYINDELYINSNDSSISELGHKLELVEKPLSVLFDNYDAYKDIEFFDNYFVVGQRFLRLLNIYDLPSSIDSRFFENYGDIVLNFKKVDSLKAKKKLDFKRKLHFSLSQELLRNIESEKAFTQNENLLEDVMTGEEAVFSMEGWILVSGESLKELNHKTDNLYQKAKLSDFKLLAEGRAQAFFFASLIPGVNPTMKREHLVPARFITGLMPFPNEELHNSGIDIHSKSGRNIGFEIFNPENQNYNLLITGASGQGKSMIANNLLYEEVKNGVKAVVLDLGNSFRKTIDYLEGTSLPTTFNPLQFKDPIYLKSFILSIVDSEFFDLTDEGRLFEVLNEMSPVDLSSIDNFIDSLECHFPKISYFFNELKPHFSDAYYEMADLLYCDLTEYPEKIKAPLIIYLIEYFKNLEGKKIFVFDECWNLLLNQADYIAECFRTFRKHEASAIAISQNLEDFLATSLGRVIFQNTYFKFLFRQSTNTEFLSDFQKEMLTTVTSLKGEYSEFLVLSDFHQKICRFYPTSFKFQLFNSDRAENLKFDQFYQERAGILDFKEIIHQYVMLKTGERVCENY